MIERLIASGILSPDEQAHFESKLAAIDAIGAELLAAVEAEQAE
jgi:hypothetical protein